MSIEISPGALVGKEIILIEISAITLRNFLGLVALIKVLIVASIVF
jgi:hypothetical protein